MIINIFFFSSRRRHTRLTCDWSSDVCSSDLLRAALDRIEWRAPSVPVMANLTGRQHQGGDRIAHVMQMQLRSPVLWAACIASLVELGCDAFVEVGPKRALTGMMRELAPGKAALAVGTPAAIEELAIP